MKLTFYAKSEGFFNFVCIFYFSFQQVAFSCCCKFHNKNMYMCVCVCKRLALQKLHTQQQTRETLYKSVITRAYIYRLYVYIWYVGNLSKVRSNTHK